MEFYDSIATPTIFDTFGIMVYVFELNNSLVKIGVSNNIGRRAGEIQDITGAKILHAARSQMAFYAKVATEIESDCHKHFASRRDHGEFFKITFDEAVAYLKSKTPVKVIK